jgi:hypothetical protein
MTDIIILHDLLGMSVWWLTKQHIPGELKMAAVGEHLTGIFVESAVTPD